MKKIILKIIFVVISLMVLSIIYLSTIGIETTKFNNKISSQIKNFNKDVDIKLKGVKLVLDIFKFEFHAKTIGSKLIIKEKILEIESIKTYISINSLINNEFSLRNLELSSKSLEIKNVISFLRKLQNNPQLYFLEKIIKKGYLIVDLKFEFDSQGKIKKNYEVKGFIKDAKIKTLKKYNFEKINFTFNLKNNDYQFKDIKLEFNQIPLKSKSIVAKKINNEFFFEGTFDDNNLSLSSKKNNFFLNDFLSNYNIENLKFDFKNDFSFNINQKFKFKNFMLSSRIKIHDLVINNQYKLKKFLPNVSEKIKIKDHILKFNYVKNQLSIDGKGDILIQNNKDFIEYKIQQKNKNYNFKVLLEINKNPVQFELLDFKKKLNSKMNLSFSGKYNPGQETIIKFLSLTEDKNEFFLKELTLDKNLRFKNLNKLEINFNDNQRKKNQLILYKEKKKYFLKGSSLNANNLIEKYMHYENDKKSNLFNKGFNLRINIEQVFLDDIYKVNNFNGDLSFKNNEIINANIKANFSENQKLKFTVQTKNGEKVTTLFLDQAESIIKRYKFIKGFKGGSLDFYSTKKNEESISNLKIYDFRLKKLPILTKLLTLASLQGIADILSGEGITFDEFEMNFRNRNNLITIDEIYSIGPAISILMEGYIEKNKLISLKGSLVPATTINKAIGTIPVLGKILVGSKTGEGVFGVSFKIKGPPKKLETTVNPIKTLTPRFITRTLEKIKKN